MQIKLEKIKEHFESFISFCQFYFWFRTSSINASFCFKLEVDMELK